LESSEEIKLTSKTASEWANQIDADIQALPKQNTSAIRAVRRDYSHSLKQENAPFIIDLAYELINTYPPLRWFGYELVRYHKDAFHSMDAAKLEALGQGINSWDTVDSFARTLSGPAWLKGWVVDETIQTWAHSEDLWWRRTALVSTVALNMRSHGGYGDTPRTLSVCVLLIDDKEDMIVKAMSWALRELAIHDPQAVDQFLKEHDTQLAARVKREVRNKMDTGFKNPKKKDL